MNWLEIIELLTATKDRNKVDQFLGDWLNKIKTDEKQCRIKVYHHAFVETDISIHLFHESDDKTIDFSRQGTQLAFALKEFGLVNHHIWIEMGSKV